MICTWTFLRHDQQKHSFPVLNSTDRIFYQSYLPYPHHISRTSRMNRRLSKRVGKSVVSWLQKSCLTLKKPGVKQGLIMDIHELCIHMHDKSLFDSRKKDALGSIHSFVSPSVCHHWDTQTASIVVLHWSGGYRSLK